MPALHRTQYIVMSVLGAWVGYPLLHQEALSLPGMLTLYGLAGIVGGGNSLGREVPDNFSNI